MQQTSINLNKYAKQLMNIQKEATNFNYYANSISMLILLINIHKQTINLNKYTKQLMNIQKEVTNFNKYANFGH